MYPASGLEAAAQVATVRNMLRFALYNGRTVVGPIAALNHTLAQNKLVTSFTALIVAKYEPALRRLTYVNCGHDDGLHLQAESGQVSYLAATGSVVGAFPESDYEEKKIELAVGDALVFYTDGLSEAGVSRKRMIGTSGIARLFEEGAPYNNPQEVATRIMSGVDEYSRGKVRDDQALLAVIVTD